MFRLKDAIAQWREPYLKDHAFTQEDVAELESHLIDKIEDFVLQGMSDEEAFKQAVHTLGHHNVLRQEYHKNGFVQKKVFNFTRAIFVITIILWYVFAVVYSTIDGGGLLNLINAINQNSWAVLIAFSVTSIAPFIAAFIGINHIKEQKIKCSALGLLIAVGLVLCIGRFIPGVPVYTMGVFAATFFVLLLSLFFEAKRLWYVSFVVVLSFSVFIFVGPVSPFSAAFDHTLMTRIIQTAMVVIDTILGLGLAYGLSRRNNAAHGYDTSGEELSIAD